MRKKLYKAGCLQCVHICCVKNDGDTDTVTVKNDSDILKC